MELTKWHIRFIDLAKHISLWSKDRSTKVGAIIIGPNREIRATGYNGFPRGVDDDIDARHERPAKYFYTEHSERNALYQAALLGVSLKGCDLYCTHFPCPDCARGIIQSGLNSVFYPEDLSEEAKSFRERSYIASKASLEILNSAGINCYIIKDRKFIDFVKEDDLKP